MEAFLVKGRIKPEIKKYIYIHFFHQLAQQWTNVLRVQIPSCAIIFMVDLQLNKDNFPSVENLCPYRNGVDIRNGRESYSETQQHGD